MRFVGWSSALDMSLVNFEKVREFAFVLFRLVLTARRLCRLRNSITLSQTSTAVGLVQLHRVRFEKETNRNNILLNRIAPV
jgi:hypothetical protein